MKEDKICYDCKYSQPICYSKKLYCSEKDKLVREDSKLCRIFIENANKVRKGKD